MAQTKIKAVLSPSATLRTGLSKGEQSRRQMVEWVRGGRSPGDLARELEPSAQAIRNWTAQADRDGTRLVDMGREGFEFLGLHFHSF